jgi:malate:quinone-oxidoreductase
MKNKSVDVLLVGAGIMSATLGALIKEVAPEWNITIVEKLGSAGLESSDPWNNAGTGHSALCELNYSVEQKDGSMDVTKAIKINEQFQVSRQFWSYLVNTGQLANPQDFIMPIPHMSLVEGDKNVKFLKKRFDVLSGNPLFAGMEYTEDTEELKQSGLILDLKKTSGSYKLYQKVLAVGPTVRDVKVGDVVQIDVIKFIVPEFKEDTNSLRESVRVRNTYTKVELPILNVNGEETMLLHESDVEYIIEDYED